MAHRITEPEDRAPARLGSGTAETPRRIRLHSWPASRTYWILLILFVELQIADILTTNQALAVPGVWELNPLDGDVAGQARRRLVGAETRGRGLSMPRGHLHAPALADHFRGVGFRPRRARQHQPFLTAAAPRRKKFMHAAGPSPASLCSAPSPAVRERGYNAFSSKLLPHRAAREEGPRPKGFG